MTRTLIYIFRFDEVAKQDKQLLKIKAKCYFWLTALIYKKTAVMLTIYKFVVTPVRIWVQIWELIKKRIFKPVMVATDIYHKLYFP